MESLKVQECFFLSLRQRTKWRAELKKSNIKEKQMLFEGILGRQRTGRSSLENENTLRGDGSV